MDTTHTTTDPLTTIATPTTEDMATMESAKPASNPKISSKTDVGVVQTEEFQQRLYQE